MAQNHNADFTEKPMTTYGRTQSPSRRYRRLRHPTFPAAEWASKNPLLQRGEIGVESDTHKVKVGDGLTYWNSLQYITADAEGQQKSTADYSMGNSSGGWTVMSTAQQDALNSGATTTNITQIGTNTTSIGNHIADTANPHQVTASQVGLGNVDNTSDADKPISTATQSALDGKQDTLTAGTNINITGSTISATDTTYTGSDGVTLTGTNFTNSGVRSVSSGTTNGTISVNTNGTSADVSVTGLGSAAYTNSSAYATAAQGTKADTAVQPGDLATVATTGSYTDLLNKPTIPAAQVNSDWNANSGVEQILNKPTLGTAAAANTTDFATAAQGALADTAVQPGDLATVATTGLYSDLTGTPSLAAVATSGLYSDLSGTPTIPAAQVNSDWNANSGVEQILNKPTTLAGYGITDAVQTGHELVAFQEPTAQNDYTWYRKYRDGWVEQGGIKLQNTSNKQDLSLPIEMNGSTYSVLTSVMDDNLTGYVFCVKVTDKTTTGFKTTVWGSYQQGISTSGYNFVWQVSGIAA